jgi:hypothetical protein
LGAGLSNAMAGGDQGETAGKQKKEKVKRKVVRS